MKCPNCHENMDTFFWSSSAMDRGCFKCGCIIDGKGRIVWYDDARASGWEQATGRRRKKPDVEIQTEEEYIEKQIGNTTEEHLHALSHELYSVRERAAVSLGFRGDKEAVEPLIAALKEDENYAVRRAAALALGRIGDTRAIQPLIASFEDNASEVRYAAVDALLMIGKPAEEALNIAWKNSDDGSVKRLAAEALDKLT